MSQLIWFSIPGAIFMSAWAFVGFPGGLDSSLKIALTLPIGFAIHQIFRTLFECRDDGWARKGRKVIDHLHKDYATEDRQKAFIVWEMTLYSSEIPEPFRKHNRDSWHYVISFWSCAFISILCPFGVCVVARIFDDKLDLKWSLLSFGMILMACVFVKKGNLTYAAINEQEVATFRLYQSAFDRIAAGLGYKRIDMFETPVNPPSKIWGLFLGFLKA